MTKKRNFKSNNPYHIYNRGNKKEKIFLAEQDYQIFENTFKCSAGEFNVWIYTWCLMDNHYHFLIKAKDPESIMLMMHKLTTSYSWYMRTKYKLVGHVFQGRYCAKEIKNESHFKTVLKYIKNNPVKEKYCSKSEYYKWLKVLDDKYELSK